MKGKSILILSFTLLAFTLLVWELVYSFSGSGKIKKPVPDKDKPVVPTMATTNTWKHYTFVKRSPTDPAIEKIISTYPKGDTIYPTDASPLKQLQLFDDTLKRSRICIFQPTSPDGKYGNWIILGDSSKITKFNAVKIDTTITAPGDKKIVVFKKEKTNVVVRDTIML